MEIKTVGHKRYQTSYGRYLEDFELGVTLGTGSFGRVRFCTHKVSYYY